jgi:tetratricopeptide (TPR) repeat protein
MIYAQQEGVTESGDGQEKTTAMVGITFFWLCWFAGSGKTCRVKPDIVPTATLNKRTTTMSFLSNIFGTKATEVKKAAAAPLKFDFRTALLMHLRGELEQALGAYLQIAVEHPDDILAPFFAAAIKAGQGNTAEAAESLRALSRQIASVGENISQTISLQLVALERSLPPLAEVAISFGDCLKKEGFLQESAVCFEIGSALTPDNSQVLYKLGDTLHDLRIYDYAESVLLEAIKYAPYHWGALYTYAVVLQDLGRDEEATSYYNRAVMLNPDHANSQNNYGAALLRTNRLEEALAHCNQAARLDPSSPLVKINLGNIYLLMQEYETARTCFTEALSLNDNFAPAYFGLASVEQSLNSNPSRIKELFIKGIEINPSIPEAHHALGNLLAGEGNPEALSHFSAAAHLNNRLKNLQKDFGRACLKLGRREEALEHLRIALQQSPDDVMVQDLIAGMEAEKPV